jgi:hypothetical protein
MFCLIALCRPQGRKNDAVCLGEKQKRTIKDEEGRKESPPF